MKNLSEIIHELDVVTKKYVDDAAGTKVDKVEGKQLSTNDYTTEEKNKLNSLENYTLPAASADALGGVKIGNNLTIDENGVLNGKDVDLTNYATKEYVDNSISNVDTSSTALSNTVINNIANEVFGGGTNV